jgi:hypothetical protein
VASTITSRLAALVVLPLVAAGCGRPYVSPLAPPPHRAEIEAGYDATWAAIVRALARENVPLRAVARDSGVIASDDFVAPIGVYADCGRVGDELLEGDAVVAFTVFAEPDGGRTKIQVNSKMRTHMYRRGSSGQLRPGPVYACASTGRFEANLLDTVRELVRP